MLWFRIQEQRCSETSGCCSGVHAGAYRYPCNQGCGQLQDTSHTLFLVLCRIQHIGTGVDRSGIHTEECQFADKRIGHDLECQCGLREYKVEANVGAPQVAYKESFTKPVDQEYKYAKQSGGRGQYGHCKVKFEPMDPNGEETFKFETSAPILP